MHIREVSAHWAGHLLGAGPIFWKFSPVHRAGVLRSRICVPGERVLKWTSNPLNLQTALRTFGLAFSRRRGLCT